MAGTIPAWRAEMTLPFPLPRPDAGLAFRGATARAFRWLLRRGAGDVPAAPAEPPFRSDLLRGEQVIAVNAPADLGSELTLWSAQLGAGGVRHADAPGAASALATPLKDAALAVVWLDRDEDADGPSRDGLARALREAAPDMPLILVSAGPGQAAFGNRDGEGFDCVLPAPLGPAAFKLAAGAAIANRKKHRNRIVPGARTGGPRPT
ncbi:hypothetical protein [Albidovulum sediminis]|uniref:Response regulatory domain-containing protein n=1 Tax=Albidovulum sediminis TaxID=3066345 RepID=A0ABT2NK34_9RHOB|nr:hypothetical protein [Defluviimonas sediminis]MCT8329276.1 hypothetical protein [Defluviimonas sediminis]